MQAESGLTIKRMIEVSLRAAAVLALCALAASHGVGSADDAAGPPVFGARRAARAACAVQSNANFLHSLKTPVESSGTLIFRAPNYLESARVEPQRETVRIEGDTVTYEIRGGATCSQKRTFALADAPSLAALIESLRATLAGDLPTLRRHYDVSWTTPGAGANRRRGSSRWCRASAPCSMQYRDGVARRWRELSDGRDRRGQW